MFTVTILSVVSFLLYWFSALTYFTASTALSFLLLLVAHKIGKRRRVFTVAEVMSVKELSIPITFRSRFSGGGRVVLRIYDIQASDRRWMFSFLTPARHEVGESIILLLDWRGRVLATSRGGRGEDIELLEKLR
ncbi:MAG TPA: hypothetical protein EYH45_06235 [Candidatus Caldiarchaeum subterraneum]|uniref:Uncharacterized protein n=1 Tax=Caldiarchaeum subterraneum TaxID=311458 RepID=A0A832ZWJ2_CALS0|nr:hypothetical protein [Aigarchaeota archaeon]HIQ30144.1 hypothetical protein [Candidatus Caldarchaeum subterraneum]